MCAALPPPPEGGGFRAEVPMNPFGVWQSDQLNELRYLRTVIVIYDGVVRDLKRALGEG